MKDRMTFGTAVFAAVLTVLLGGCQPQRMEEQATTASKAVAAVHPTEGSGVHGTVTFTKSDGALRVVADIEGLTPGKHGFHLHEYGDCSAPDATSAGGHFNPDGQAHSGPTAAERHCGDLGNLTAAADGRAHLDWTDPLLSFGGVHSIIGLAVILHAGEDDLTSQPTGNAGGRVACGVIGVAKP